MSTADDLTFRCDECEATITAQVIPREGANLRCDCGHLVALGDLVGAFPETWLTPGPFLERRFACAECGEDVRVDHIFDHWADAHGRELTEEAPFMSAREDVCSMCHKLLRLPIDTPGAVLHFDHTHELRLFEDDFYEAVEAHTPTP